MARVLSVGQCGYDHGSIGRFLKQNYNAEVTAADSSNQAIVSLRAGTFDLVLVNRVFDADGASGLDFIRDLKGEADLSGTPVMLVSDMADAQEKARSLGALPGFGKGDVRSGQPVESLARALQGTGADPDA